MARMRSVDFLPEIFQTPANKQFLSSTLDQLVQEPNFQRTQGYIGRRIGPGVNANDSYIAEPTANRSNYQLEPGVVFRRPDEDQADDVITYPGMIDSLALRGAITDRADRLFSSQYYCWDPFVDYDKLINYSEYYWLPSGPLAVQVSGTVGAARSDILVNRNQDYYTFDTVQGVNPTLTLVRGRSYNFNVRQNRVSTFSFRVTNRGSLSYVIDFQTNPTLTLVRGNTYEFNLVLSGEFPFWIKTLPSVGLTNIYDRGVINNGARAGVVFFTVPYDAPDILYYASETSPDMRGQFNIEDPVSGNGPGFFIQVDPGTSGQLAGTPNISGRDVLGVVNNGEDFGTVTFNVPQKTAQNFYYTLPKIPDVDLISTLKFNQVNGAYVDQFIEQFGGIDGITDLENKTVVFPEQVIVRDANDAIASGWTRDIPYGQFPSDDAQYVGQPGSYDVPNYATQAPIIPREDRYVVWQIRYRTDLYGNNVYIELERLFSIANFEKFFVLSGREFASTEWYKNSEGYIERVPLLTAVLDNLFYQDGSNPAMFGQIRLIEEGESSTIFIEDIIDQANYTSPNGVVFTNGLKVQFRDSIEPAAFANNSYYVEGVGTAIKLVPVSDLLTPEPYTQDFPIPFDSLPFDVGNYDFDENQPVVPDYITINRASPDINAWSRSNRWFHRQVLEDTAFYTNTTAIIDQESRAKRPILEFRAGMKLFDFGTAGKIPINIIDFQSTDAFSQINGQNSFNIDGYQLDNGSRVIFAADTDPDVRNRVYQVEFISPDTISIDPSTTIIKLVPAADSEALRGDVVVSLDGNTQGGRSFWFDGESWRPAQQKSSVNQSPLFDLYDQTGVSLADDVRYPGSNFRGCSLFAYARGTGLNDPNLGFALRYLTINNVGDIVFDNTFYTDRFLYVANRASVEENVSIGFARQYRDRDNFQSLIGWQPARERSRPYQQFTFRYNGTPLLLDVRVQDQPNDLAPPTAFPVIKIYTNAEFVPPEQYTFTRTENSTTIRLDNTYTEGDLIEVLVLSEQVSPTAFYQIPVNLENNALNQNSSTFTLGTIRTHYNSIAQNLLTFLGPINGSNNSRDLGNIVPYGEIILQQSSPLTLPGLFLRDPDLDVFKALDFNSQQYQKFKDLLLDTAISIDIENKTTAEILQEVLDIMNLGKSSTSAFYWSDMLPATAGFETTQYVVTAISTPTFDTLQSYDFQESNYRAINVFVNNRLLTIGQDYVVNKDSLTITVITALSPGDVVMLQEYPTTVGNYVPNTPTKMGMYPSWIPKIYVDETYATPTRIILGHDGSKTVAFDDFRDELLLEFETRIYNNLKIKSDIPIRPEQVIPAFFRKSDYTQQEIQSLLAQSFLGWTGANRLDYTEQQYEASDPFSYNYSTAGNKLTGTVLPGAWRGIYLDFYDTLSPNLTPWEMLGFNDEPSWWTGRYGSAPYTDGNLVLWDDLERGFIAEPGNERIDLAYARPGLSEILPVGPGGELLNPLESVVGAYDPTGFRGVWRTGDLGPVEYSWRVSSAYPFAVMRLYALTRPAEFYSLFADRDLYRFDDDLDQYLYQGRYRLDANNIQVYGSGVSKASYINWIVDYTAFFGNLQPQRTLSARLADIRVRLCYRMAGFSDKRYLQLFLEKPTPASSNTSLMLPDESYDLLLYQNPPGQQLVYSSVVVQRVEQGWRVFGYSEDNPYFPILVSRPVGSLRTIQAGSTSVRVSDSYTNEVVLVPYGYVFTNTTVVADFLLSYGQYLIRQGMQFGDVENGKILDWDQMVEEFLYWANQGWQIDSIISLNPAANQFRVSRANLVVSDTTNATPFDQILDQNKQQIPNKELLIQREGNTFSLETNNEQSISFVKLTFTSFEHVMIFRNASVFGDLVYDPTTGARQTRLLMIGILTGDWDGRLDAQGFILNSDNIREWSPNRGYTKGEIVRFKNQLWSALVIVQPSAEFDFDSWAISDYDQIAKGLLPNIANKADQLANSYNIANPNLLNDNDLLAYGLTGFRPRTYLSALDLNDISQVNVYSQFLKTKGTTQSTRLLKGANFGKEVADYDIFENWAILSGTYGAQFNRRFVDLRLNAALLTANPSVIQLVEPDSNSLADQAIVLGNVFATSSVLTSNNILPTVSGNYQPVLPSAGYVNLDDVDITLYDLDDVADLDDVLASVAVGKTIWVAKVNAYDWNIYRAGTVPAQIISVSDNLDGTSLVSFNGQHGLSAGETVLIKEFGNGVDGSYRVVTVPGLYSITIEFAFSGDLQIEATGTGLAFTLTSIRVPQPRNIALLPFANDIRSGARVWVDETPEGGWAVLEKRTPIRLEAKLLPPVTGVTVQANTNFAQSISQRADNLIALIGRPDQPGQRGEAISYLQNFTNVNLPRYLAGNSLNLSGVPEVLGYGWSTSIGGNDWAAIGAPFSAGDIGYVAIARFNPGSQQFEETQLLLALDQPGPCQFGYSVSMSADDRWLYVGAPGNSANRGAVYVYGRQDVQPQSVSYDVTQASSAFSVGNIQYTNDRQLRVFINETPQYLGYDYTVTNNLVVFDTVIAPGTRITISRTDSAILDSETWPNLGGIASAVGRDARFRVTLIRGTYEVIIVSGGEDYVLGETITIPGTVFGGTTPANDCVITVESTEGLGVITRVSVAGSFIPLTGLPKRFELDDFLYPIDDVGSVSVFVDGVLQRPKLDYEFISSDDGSTLPDSTSSQHILDFCGSKILSATDISSNSIITFTPAFDFNIDDEVKFANSFSGLVADTPYYVFSVLSSTEITLSASLGGSEINSLTDVSGITEQFATPCDLNVPGVGAEIRVMNGSYFRYVGKIFIDQPSTLIENARFGEAVSTGSNGRQFLIGAPGTNENGTVQAGSAYVYDRMVQRFQVTNPQQTVYTPGAPLIAPINVLVNGQFLENSYYSNSGGFTEDGTSVTITVPLQLGDTIEIETNRLSDIQAFDAQIPSIRARFGSAVTMCSTDCSLYVGAPNTSFPGAAFTGSVQRNFNTSQAYGTITSNNQNPVLTVGDTVRINNFEVAVPNVASGLRLQALAEAINQQVSNVLATVVDGRITLSVINLQATLPNRRLTVLPGSIGSAWYALGFTLFPFAQTISNPNPTSSAGFGSALAVNTASNRLTVAAPNGDVLEPVTFDRFSETEPNSQYQLDPDSLPRTPTTFDSLATTFYDLAPQSGVVYTYDLLPAVNGSATNVGQFVLGQQIFATSLALGDRFGTALSFTNNVLLIGAPGSDLEDSVADEGAFYEFNNVGNVPSWQAIRRQPPTVDVDLLNGVSIFDRLISTTNRFLDFFDPRLGKMLGSVASNIDFTSAIDPAVYNQNQTDLGSNVWSQRQLGQVWWDTGPVRFIDPGAGDLKYSAFRWGQIFPGSQVHVYQWISSSVPPVDYTGVGVPYDVTKFTVLSEINAEGIIEPVYFFWVRGIDTVARRIGKTLSVETVARYIENPRSSGISYLAPLSPSAVAIYNSTQYLSASDSILHIEYDYQANQDNVHQEFELLAEDQPLSFLNPRLYIKMQDSLSGQTARGLPVPDPELSPGMRYGVEFSPRQSMVVDRLLALKNYITRANEVMARFALAENRNFTILELQDPEPLPNSGQWDDKVENLEQLSWQNINIVPIGYRYLVASDADNDGLWTIYTVTLSTTTQERFLLLTKVQSWDVRQYWDYTDWYAPGYDPSTQILTEVPNTASLDTLTLPLGSSVRVVANSQNKWEIYQLTVGGWVRVALEDGTISISSNIYDYAQGRIGFDGEVFDAQYFDSTPQIETRYIIQALNQEIFVGDLLIERNRLMILLFNFILSEQESPSWLLKTSLIDVTHRIRELLPFQTYRRDNQDFVLQYINEVKPYHSQIRQFNLQYTGNDDFMGDLADYDLPAFFSREAVPAQFVSPVLVSAVTSTSAANEFAPNAGIWLRWPYSQWFQNYLLDLGTIEVVDGGSGYEFPPVVTITGDAEQVGIARSIINSLGQVVAVVIEYPGFGYRSTPTVVFSSASGQGARAVARMVNDLVRSMRVVLNYDRYQYRPSWLPWVPNETFDNGTLVEFNGRVWEANSPDSTGVNTPEFDPIDWLPVPAGNLSGVDRTMAYYVAAADQPGKNLPLLITGVDYPGVQISGVPFDASTGYDSDPYDTFVFDNIQISPEGTPTYSDRILDTIYGNSSFTDIFLGTRPTDVNVVGGEFVDTYNSHAPEELVPGSEFDTLDMRVFTTPGADWLDDGHGFNTNSFRTEFDPFDPVISFEGLVSNPVTLQATNATKRIDLNLGFDYTIDWPSQTITVLPGINVSPGDLLMLRIFELGGGNQVFRGTFLGTDVIDSILIIPIEFDLIEKMVIFDNGMIFNDFTYRSSLDGNSTVIEFDVLMTDADFLSITAMGLELDGSFRDWSIPVSQYISVTDPSQTTYALTNSLEGTNPANIIVLRNGIRARPSQTQSYVANGVTSDFFLPQRGGFNPGLISDPDVTVYLDNVLQFQFTNYIVEPWDGSSLRKITFVVPPPAGAEVLIAVSTRASYLIDTANNQISFRISSSFGLSAGDVLQITTWNDTSQQRLETRLFVGPVETGTLVSENYDMTPFSYGEDLNEPGSYDYSDASGTTTINDLDLGRPELDPTRLWVTLNGRRLVTGQGFTVEYINATTYLILPQVLGPTDTVVVTICTDSVVPNAMAFRIFQDMRGVQNTYRITPETTTVLVQDLAADADIIYVRDVNALGTPNVAAGNWGVITIGAERIMYREKNIANNTVSSLMRGTAGTAASSHSAGVNVYDMSEGNRLGVSSASLQENYVVSTTTLADGTNRVFSAPDISLLLPDGSSVDERFLRVFVGGIAAPATDYVVIDDAPATVSFLTPPPAGVDVTLAVLRSNSWYQRGIDTASDGRPLQETNTESARFLRGL